MPLLRKVSVPVALACLLAFAGVSEAAQLTRTPYLQSVTPTSALVAFRTDTDCAPRVRFGLGADTSRIATASATGRLHAVKMEGLQPGAEYSYAVEACGATTKPLRFTTASTPSTRRVRFAAVGDFGTAAPTEVAVGHSILTRKPELFLGLGDVAYESGTEEEFQKNMFEPLAPLLSEVPMFATLGNHEYVTDKAQPYVDNFYLPTNNPSGTERYYSFDWGPAHFISLDSNCLLGLTFTQGRCTQAEQQAWLAADLAATQQPWKIVFMHHPPWSSGDHGSLVNLRDMLAPVFEKYGVDLVLTGHDHEYERTYPMKGNAVASGGITYVVVGNGSWPQPFVSAQPDWSAVRSSRSVGYLDVSIDEGRLSAQMVTPEGDALDSFQLGKTLPPRPAEWVLTAEHSHGPGLLEALLVARTTLPGATVQWDFGDGQTARGESVSHVYASPGSYAVTVTATAGSQVLTQSLTVTAEATSDDPASSPSTQEPGVGTSPPPGSTPGAPSVSDLESPPQAGCSSAGAGGWLLMVAPLAWVLARRRRRK